MKNKLPLTTLLLITGAMNVSNADIVWDGNVDFDFYNEANWADTNNGNANPEADSINVDSAFTIVATYLIQDIGTEITAGGGTLTFGNASIALTLDNSSLILSGSNGINGAGSLNLINGASATSQFMNLSTLTTIDGTSSLTLKGGGNPINNSSTITLSAGAVVNFNGESTIDILSEHGTKIFIGGNAISELVAGVDYTLVSTGANSSTLTAVVPEPSSYALLAGCLGLASVMLRRRS